MHLGIGATSPTVCVSTGYIHTRPAAVAPRASSFIVRRFPVTGRDDYAPWVRHGAANAVSNAGGRAGNGTGLRSVQYCEGANRSVELKNSFIHSAFGRRRTPSCLRLLLSRAPLRRDQVARKKNTVSESQEEFVRPRSVRANVVADGPSRLELSKRAAPLNASPKR